jgi:hypothetical protein
MLLRLNTLLEVNWTTWSTILGSPELGKLFPERQDTIIDRKVS